MRTIIDISSKVFAAVKAAVNSLANAIGAELIELATVVLRKKVAVRTRNGVPLLNNGRRRGTPVTLEIVNALRDEDP